MGEGHGWESSDSLGRVTSFDLERHVKLSIRFLELPYNAERIPHRTKLEKLLVGCKAV